MINERLRIPSRYHSCFGSYFKTNEGKKRVITVYGRNA